MSKCGLILMLLLAVWNVGWAQDSLGMRCLSSLNYWQYTESIQMVGDLAYVVGGYSGLHIMSLADPANPVVIGRFTWYQWYGSSGGVYVLGNRAYLGLYMGGIVLDVTDPTHPVTLGQWYSGHMGDISFVHGDYAIAETDEGYPYVLDVSDPTNVHQIGSFPGITGPQRGVGMAGEYLCLTGNPGGLVLFDMTNPADPQWIASIDTALSGHYATISGTHGYLPTLYNGLRIIDLSNPLEPVEVAVCDTSGWTEDVTVTGSHAVTTKYSETDVWLNVWNVADPTHPVLEGTIHPEALGSGIISSSGNLVCTVMTEPNDAVMVVDISNPAEPVVVSSFGPYGLLTRVAIIGTTAYLADRITGLRTMDIADPHHMSELAHMNAYDARGSDVAFRGNHAYVTESLYGGSTDGVVVFEVSNPAAPESIFCVMHDGARKILIEGDYAYVAGLQDLCTFSLANPAIPQLVNAIDPGYTGEWSGLDASNGYLYYGCSATLYVYSLSNPAEPQLAGSCNLGGGSVFDLEAADDYVYVADGYSGMRIVDVSNPTNPSELNRIDGYWVGSVAAAGNTVIMGDLSRISIYDVTYPEDPRLVGYYPTHEDIIDMGIQGQYLFTTSMCEFRVYECDALTNVIKPSDPIPTEFSLLPPYPNPFNSQLSIPFTIPFRKEVIINIYNILGQRVQEFTFPSLAPGVHRVVWNSGASASGVYLVRMNGNGQECQQKAVLLK